MKPNHKRPSAWGRRVIALLDAKLVEEVRSLWERHKKYHSLEDILTSALHRFPLDACGAEVIQAVVRRYVKAARSGLDINLCPLPWRDRDPLPQTVNAGGRKSRARGTLLRFPALR